ncbi:hypothetical protein N7528_003642 [Penicillium herquei]|nr:hypothetical protein N7528_003642 [Penicillium herquei]
MGDKAAKVATNHTVPGSTTAVLSYLLNAVLIHGLDSLRETLVVNPAMQFSGSHTKRNGLLLLLIGLNVDVRYELKVSNALVPLTMSTDLIWASSGISEVLDAPRQGKTHPPSSRASQQP